MSNTQLAEIEASLVSIARRAYELGRSDAFNKVVAVVNGDRNEPLALMAPDSGPKPEAPKPETPPQVTNGAQRQAGTPWWAFPVR